LEIGDERDGDARGPILGAQADLTVYPRGELKRLKHCLTVLHRLLQPGDGLGARGRFCQGLRDHPEHGEVGDSLRATTGVAAHTRRERSAGTARMELELSDFDLPAAIENALMLVRERAARRSIALNVAMDPQLGQIQADERKVRQVVLNLLSNAIKFTAEGGRIDVGAVPKDGFVEVSVTDTGIGIAPEDQEKVFEEFRQVGTADKKAEGTGLGLTLCRKFIDLHGGKIWVKSQVGQGSTFTFTIPVHQGG